MQVEIKIDSSYIDPKVIILTASMTEDVSNIAKRAYNVDQTIIRQYFRGFFRIILKITITSAKTESRNNARKKYIIVFA